jgi:capsule biosynthesis phosphatase
LENLNIDDQPVLSLDGDNFFSNDIVKLWNGQDMVFTQTDNSNLECFSFIKVDDNDYISDIVEKKRISNLASVGCYGFSSYKKLLYNCQEVIKKNLKYKNEFYISNVIKLMITEKINIKNITIDKKYWHCIGTPLQLKYFYNNYPKISCNDNKQKIKNIRVCFDLDNTLVTFPKIKNDYTSVEPIQKNIDFLKYIKSFGNTIIIYTARRMKTFSGNTGKVLQNVGKITFNTLEKFDIPYDEIYFGKPQADFYIDDLAVNCFSNLDKKMGFYLDKIKPRDFNSLEINNFEVVTKKSDNLDGEIFYYKNIPNKIKDLFPIFISSNKINTEYTIQKIEGITVSVLYVSQLLTKDNLYHIMNSINRIHGLKIPDEYNIDIDIYANYVKKLENRYTNYDYSSFPNSDIIYNKLLEKLTEYQNNNLGNKSIIHGDPVMTNILINNYEKIKFIDMRGKIDNRLSLVGDSLYDWAKLYQSIIGYDHILLDKEIDLEYQNKIKNVFNDYIINLYSKEKLDDIKLITNSLLFSLIPLHDNEKCNKYYNLIDI